MKQIVLHLLSLVVTVCSFAQVSNNSVTTVPVITSFTPSGGPVGTLVTISGTDLNSPTAFTIGGVSAVIVSNNGTTLVGMVMPGATNGNVSVTTAGGVATSSGSFTVAATPYPNAQQGGKLVGSDFTGTSYQGYSVAISANGNTAVVGGYSDNGDQGAAWVYTRSGNVWSQQGAKLVGTGAVGNAEQGVSVAINADGNTVLIGGKIDNGEIGAAWIFTRSGGVWSQQGNKLVPSDAIGNAQFGTSVSLSADGNTAMVGGAYDNSFLGAAWIFTRSGGVWSQQAKLIAADANPRFGFLDYQGVSVAISADGNTAIVGATFDGDAFGAAWIYIRNGGVWTQQGPKLLDPTYGSDTQQGNSVALSADGNTAIVGASHLGVGDGGAYVYTRSAGTWTEQGGLFGSGAGGSAQGTSVALSADGNIAVSGGPDDGGTLGRVWVFSRLGTVWTGQNTLVGSGSVGGVQQGQSVSLSADGKTLLVGGPIDNSTTGAAWVFVAVQPPTITSFSPASGPHGTLVTVTGTNLDNLTSFTIGGVPAIVVSNSGSTLVGMVMPGATTGGISVITIGGTANGSANFTVTAPTYPATQQGGKLVSTDNTGAAQQGNSVAISADGNTAIVGAYNDNSNTGAAWIYTRSGGVWTQQGGKLVGTGAIGNAQQGSAVALSADGNTAIVGGFQDDGVIGAVWIFTRTGGVWTQQGSKLVGTGSVSTSSNVYQGFSVSMSADGNTAIVGGLNDNGNQGAAWIFTRNGSVWSQQGNKLVGTGGSTDAQQGYAVALSADGNTAMVGGYLDNGTQGAAWIFTRSGGVWSQQGNKLVGTGNVGTAYQGTSVALSADGNTAMSGGFADNSSVGAAWIFTRTGGVWTQQGNKLVGTGIGNGYQGSIVSLSADGNTAISGGGNDNSGVGAAWVFTRTGSTWSQSNKLVGTGNIGASGQGYSAALSADGSTAILGGLYDNSNQGAAWIFAPSAPVPVTFINLIGQQKGKDVQLTWNVGNESNIDHYEVERSATGRVFTKINNTGIAAVNNGKASYTWTDNNPNQDLNFYRIRSVDREGVIHYTNIIRIARGAAESITISPNPLTGSKVNVQFSNTIVGVYTLRVINSNGQVLHQTTFNLDGGSSTQSLQLPYKLASGVYVMEITKPSGDKQTTQLIVQ